MTADAPATDEWETADSPAGPVVKTRFWRRAAGTAAIVAVLIVGNAAQASATAGSIGKGTNPALRSASSAGFGSSDRGTARAGRHGESRTTVGVRPGVDDASATAGAALHGEFTVLNRDGSAQLRRWQSGQVDSIDSVSVSVVSADGFNGTYLLGPGVSITGIGVGDDVTVVGAGQAVPMDV